MLGDIPEPPKQLNSLKFCHELVVHPLIQHSKGVSINGAAFGFDYEESKSTSRSCPRETDTNASGFVSSCE